MQIELTTPACLCFGLTRSEGQLCQLGITLRFPPVQLLARPAPGLTITGGRADLAHRQAKRFFRHYKLAPQAEVEIELAIPSFMGLGSSALLGLSVAEALANIHTITPDATDLAAAVGLGEDAALERHAFATGGLLLVDERGDLRRRQTITHRREEDDWVFVFVLPRVPSGTAETLEADRRRALFGAAAQLDAQIEHATEELWTAAQCDDFAAFAGALMTIQGINEAALAYAGQPLTLVPEEDTVLNLMRAGGTLACGRTLLGYALYGLIRGGSPSRALRQALSQYLGFFGGTVMATLCDNEGRIVRDA